MRVHDSAGLLAGQPRLRPRLPATVRNACASGWKPGSRRRSSPSKTKAICMQAMQARRMGIATFAFGSWPRRFAEYPAVARHRLVYAAVDDLMKTDIHALAIEALPPVE